MKFSEIPRFITEGSWECDYTIPMLINFIQELEQEEGLEMNPDFQRGHVWTEEQQVNYLEFFLKGGKTARVIYLNINDWQTEPVKPEDKIAVCVDGLQRYTTFKRFYNNEIKAFGCYYKEFTDSPRAYQWVKLNINNLRTRKEVLEWYIQFNSGGTVHSKEEINKVKELLKQEEMK